MSQAENDGKMALSFLRSCRELKKSERKYGECEGKKLFAGNPVDAADRVRALIQAYPDLEDVIKNNCGLGYYKGVGMRRNVNVRKVRGLSNISGRENLVQNSSTTLSNLSIVT